MYAVVSIWSRDKARTEEQMQTLQERIVPNVRQSRGFVAGYWTNDHATGKDHVMIVLDTEENARAFKANVEQQRDTQLASGVTMELMTVTEVLASA